MQILNRLVGALLLLTAAIVGIYFVVDQLEVLPFLWGELDYLMALALVLGRHIRLPCESAASNPPD